MITLELSEQEALSLNHGLNDWLEAVREDMLIEEADEGSETIWMDVRDIYLNLQRLLLRSGVAPNEPPYHSSIYDPYNARYELK